ncbi:MAG: ribulose-1,5-biphosphate synthetase [Candidatus Aramenus sulfurataquae]|jgi:thiamine thiazole synthase|uniref:Thiamine thiazole synthase n=2 Tax=Candidatus Aramenus sulfurataquae TaxID=1326980 RepID=W7KQ83_9CREN|nr:MAG: ribulose-1,5-biphosphate synthetase [Candidatus Aramenus sulfurataquae]MBW9141482.1 sulfide-dependent adenosine diphosphate thiazole synthase [Candidatus Aramenus sp.]MCL7343444.1 sulfide-dependent adenosine diphosphate thiazole synthase [Candidatus Aramenus sulfurataquae]
MQSIRIKQVDEVKISRYILKYTFEDWYSLVDSDVVVVGAGPSGLATAYFTAKAGLKTVVFERRLSFGGGIGGGAMNFHKIVIESPADELLREWKVKLVEAEEGVFIVDAAEFMAKLGAAAIDAGAKVIHGINVDDVIFRDKPLRVAGVAVEWTSTQMSGLHVDPLFVSAKAVVDATGHDAEILSVASRKIPELGIVIPGEKSAYSEVAEELVVNNAGKVAEGLYTTGMAVCEVKSLPRMGPIFGAMVLSGKKVAEDIINDLRNS